MPPRRWVPSRRTQRACLPFDVDWRSGPDVCGHPVDLVVVDPDAAMGGGRRERVPRLAPSRPWIAIRPGPPPKLNSRSDEWLGVSGRIRRPSSYRAISRTLHWCEYCFSHQNLPSRGGKSCKYGLNGARPVAALTSHEDRFGRARERSLRMDLVSIALVIVAFWIVVVVLVLAMCKASGHADADEERHFAEGRDDVSNRLPAPYADVALGDHRRPIDAAKLERESERLGIELPERRRRRLPHLVGTHRHRP